ncbi:conserved protein of unknown function [Ectopseudomonas oleovorans]|uniref:Uncharacterized protein n=1 Tax=Ectopseudomonas oleovorans TaxID=301 RepID=A0A653B5K4_ECTOL|nr:conserved protein of unknown function [Pseudomonas oleovorans]
MSLKKVTDLVCHHFVCLPFPVFASLGFRTYTSPFGVSFFGGLICEVFFRAANSGRKR